MPFREHVVRGHVSSEHIAQLFDSLESLADAVALFVRDGLDAGDVVLALVAPERWASVSAQLTRLGVNVWRAIANRRLVVLDSARTLERLSQNGMPARNRFEGIVGSLVGELRAGGARLRIHGDMVDLLAARGDFAAAHRLEELWNDLSERHSFALFCGYSAEHFGDARAAGSLRLICRAHSYVRSHPRDPLGIYLLQSLGNLRTA